MWAGQLSRYNDWLWAGQSGDQIPVGARFSAPVQTGPGAYPASCTMSTGSFPVVKSGRCLTLTPHSLLVPWSWKGTAIPLLPLWAIRPVQNLSACTRVHCTFFYHIGKKVTNLYGGYGLACWQMRNQFFQVNYVLAFTIVCTQFLLHIHHIYGYRVFPGGKLRPGRAADASPASSAVVMEE